MSCTKPVLPGGRGAIHTDAVILGPGQTTGEKCSHKTLHSHKWPAFCALTDGHFMEDDPSLYTVHYLYLHQEELQLQTEADRPFTTGAMPGVPGILPVDSWGL